MQPFCFYQVNFSNIFIFPKLAMLDHSCIWWKVELGNFTLIGITRQMLMGESNQNQQLSSLLFKVEIKGFTLPLLPTPDFTGQSVEVD